MGRGKTAVITIDMFDSCMESLNISELMENPSERRMMKGSTLGPEGLNLKRQQVHRL